MLHMGHASAEAMEYAKKLRVWYKEMENDKRAPRPPLPRFLALDMSLGGVHADSLERMAKNGEFEKIKVVVFHDAHEERYFLVRESEDYAKIALSIIQERSKDGWYGYNVKDSQEEVPVIPKVTIDQAATMDDEVQKTVAEMWKRYHRDVWQKKIMDELMELLSKALKGDALAAVKFLCVRRKYEYEAYEVITPRVAGGSD